jgi:hypothetical protein
VCSHSLQPSPTGPEQMQTSSLLLLSLWETSTVRVVTHVGGAWWCGGELFNWECVWTPGFDGGRWAYLPHLPLQLHVVRVGRRVC